MEIRRLRKGDAKFYKAIRLKSLRDAPDAFGSDYAAEKKQPLSWFQGRIEQNVIFGAFDKNNLYGVVSFTLNKNPKTKHKASVWGMFVSAEKRGSGIARLLMKTLLEFAEKKKEIELIQISAVTTNIVAKKLYQSLGFKSWGIEKRAFKNKNGYQDDEHMVKFLR